MWYVLEDTVPKNTAYANRRSTSIRVHGGILHSIIITIPPGTAFTTNVQLRKASYYILPRNEDKSITGRHVNVNYREWYKMKAAENKLTMEAWNTSKRYDHTVRMLLGILPIEVLEVEENYLQALKMFMRMFRRRA